MCQKTILNYEQQLLDVIEFSFQIDKPFGNVTAFLDHYFGAGVWRRNSDCSGRKVRYVAPQAGWSGRPSTARTGS
jgi:hypothetical protein